MTITRRGFIQTGAMALAALPPLTKLAPATPMGQPVGFQTFEIMPHLTEDWQGTWNAMARFGYKIADMVRYGMLAAKTSQEIYAALMTAGLSVTNCHFSFEAWSAKYEETLQYARDLKLKSVVCALGPRRKTVDDWKWMADQLNTLGGKLKGDGLMLGYHNHEIEFRPVEGQIPWDILITNTDPKLVHYQIDVGNLTFGGGDAVMYLEKYPGRYYSLHCKDFVKGIASVPVGQGTLDWPRIFAIAKKQGIESYVTEVGAYGVSSLDGTPLEQSKLDVLESFRQSIEFMKTVRN